MKINVLVSRRSSGSYVPPGFVDVMMHLFEYGENHFSRSGIIVGCTFRRSAFRCTVWIVSPSSCLWPNVTRLSWPNFKLYLNTACSWHHLLSYSSYECLKLVLSGISYKNCEREQRAKMKDEAFFK